MGSTLLTLSKTSIGLNNIDNTSDLNKPVSTATQAALDLKQIAFCGIDSATPVTVSFDYNTLILTVTGTLGYFNYYTDGNGVITKFNKIGPQVFPAMTNTSGMWYFYFNQSGTAVTTQTAWSDFSLIAPVYRLLWNATLTGSARSITEAIEYHPNDISCADHTWKHNYGAVWTSGFNIVATPLASGLPTNTGINTCIGLTSGSNIDDNLPYTITNSTNAIEWNQDLGNITPASLTYSNSALLNIRYQGSNSLQYKLAATRFPFAFNSSTNIPQYITSTGVRTDVTSSYYFVYFISSIQDKRNGEAIKLVSAPNQYSAITNARAINWSDIQASLTSFSDKEVRPLYRLIFEYRSSYSSAVKYSVLREVQDLRQAAITQTTSSGTLPATSISVSPIGNITSTNVQSALGELDSLRINNNLMINGDLIVAERGTTFVSPANGTSVIDRFRYYKTGDMLHTISRDTNVPTISNINTQYSLKVDCTTADTSIGASDICSIAQTIEGYKIAPYVGKYLTFSFYVNATKTGTYCLYFTNSGFDRSYIAEYTVNTSNTWEYKKVTIPMNYSGGTWNYTNGTGLYVAFTLAGGSSFYGTANTWNSSSVTCTSNQVNACDSTDNNFYITNIKLEGGTVATQFIPRLYEIELSLCQRYGFSIGGSAAYQEIAGGIANTTGQALPAIKNPVPMRAPPTSITYSSVNDWALQHGSTLNSAITSISLGATSPTVTRLVCASSGLTVGEYCHLIANNTTNARLFIDAELS